MRWVLCCVCACVGLAISPEGARSETPAAAAVTAHPSSPSEQSPPPERVPLPRLRPASAPPAIVRLSTREVCETLAASAAKYRLPIAFFGNLIYKESSLRSNVVSRAGARGIAQFMPRTQRLVGLKNPFNPREALPASAKFLNILLHRFDNNYGLAAAAYNAGPTRVSRWLKRGKSLPGETRKYVAKITGKPAEEWRGARGNDFDTDLSSNVPCAELRAFAELETNPASAHSTRPRRFVLPMPLPHPHRVATETAGESTEAQAPLRVNIEVTAPPTRD